MARSELREANGSLIVWSQYRGGRRGLFARLLLTAAGSFVGYVGGITIEQFLIPPVLGWIVAVLAGLSFLRWLIYWLRPFPTLKATDSGICLFLALRLKTGPIYWGEISRFEFHPESDDSAARLSIVLMDAAATYQRLGQTWSGLLRWLLTLGDPLHLHDEDVDRPLEELMWQLRDLHAANVNNLPR